MGTKVVSVHVIGRYLDMTPRRVQQLAKAGKIPKASRGHYELLPAIHGYVHYMRGLLAVYSGLDGEPLQDLIEAEARPAFDPEADINMADFELPEL